MEPVVALLTHTFICPECRDEVSIVLNGEIKTETYNHTCTVCDCSIIVYPPNVYPTTDEKCLVVYERKIKLCPFCGSEGMLSVVGDNDKTKHTVECSNVSGKCPIMPRTLAFDTFDDAINAWNRRF